MSGFTVVIVATAIAGIAGYLVTWLVYRQVGAASYTVFAIFWAALYLVVGGLAGIQQEITRATYRIESGSRTFPSRARNFAIVASLSVFCGVLFSALLWVDSVFPQGGWTLVWPLAVGAGSYVLVATLSGSLYGISQWRSLGLMIGADGVLRLALLLVALMMTQNILVLAWVVALPFPLVILLLWPVIRGGLIGRTDLDVRYLPLVWNVSRTVLASISTAVLVSGFPLLLGVTAHAEDPALVGELIFTITLTRAPLIVTVMSLQSYLVVKFRDHPASGLVIFIRAQAVIIGGAAILALLGSWLGPIVFTWISGKPGSVDGLFIALLVGSSALVAALCVSGSAVLALSQHKIYSLGWLAAAVVTIVIMILPLALDCRVGIALIAGPVAGLLLHCFWLLTVGGRLKGKTVS